MHGGSSASTGCQELPGGSADLFSDVFGHVCRFSVIPYVSGFKFSFLIVFICFECMGLDLCDFGVERGNENLTRRRWEGSAEMF